MTVDSISDGAIHGIGLCQCGCGEPAPIALQNHSRYGWVKGEPLRYVRGHNRRKSPHAFRKEDRGYGSPCWIWQRATDQRGYGHINIGRRFHRAHRWYYERWVGPIPEGMQLDHLCKQPSCVNPDHLEVVTNAENTRRGARAKLNVESVAALRSSSESTSALAAQLGVHYDTAWAARTGRSWS